MKFLLPGGRIVTKLKALTSLKGPIFLLYHIYLNLVVDIAGGKEAEGVWEQNMMFEENIWT